MGLEKKVRLQARPQVRSQARPQVRRGKHWLPVTGLQIGGIGIWLCAVTPVFANTAQPGPSIWEQLAIPIGFFILLYIVLIRPQANKIRKQRDFVAALKSGDKVVVSGGILGQVKRVQPQWVSVDVGCGVIRVLKDNVYAREEHVVVQVKSGKADESQQNKEQKTHMREKKVQKNPSSGNLKHPSMVLSSPSKPQKKS